MVISTNFRNDIQGRDTNLVPVIVIGNVDDADGSLGLWDNAWFISTNNLAIEYGVGALDAHTTNTLPILENIPAIKESIDIEKRNYRISNVSIQLSNYEYNGVRFSELVGDSSLINIECRIYWVSPNTTLLVALDDGYANNGIVNDPAFEVYYGVIRRYEHDDDKVKLTVEDRSQSKLHRDLPE